MPIREQRLTRHTIMSLTDLHDGLDARRFPESTSVGYLDIIEVRWQVALKSLTKPDIRKHRRLSTRSVKPRRGIINTLSNIGVIALLRLPCPNHR